MIMKITFERWLRRPARLAVLAGAAAFSVPLAMAPASAEMRPAAASTEAGSTQPTSDELSSRRHGAGSRPSHAGRHHRGGRHAGRHSRSPRYDSYPAGMARLQQGGRPRNKSLGVFGTYKKAHKSYTAGPSYKTRGHKRAARQYYVGGGVGYVGSQR
jgi:hypothetical protein